MLDVLSTAIIAGPARLPAPEFKPPHAKTKPPVFVNFVTLPELGALSLTYTNPDESTATPKGVMNLPGVDPWPPNEPMNDPLFLKIWTRWFPRSTTYTNPLALTLSPIGVVNWPFPDPVEPQDVMKLPLAVNF